MFTVTTIREKVTSAGRVFEVAKSRPSLLGRVLVWITLLLGALVVFLVVLPFLVAGVVLTLVLTGIARVWLWAVSAKRDNGLLDGRRNVRVVNRSGDPGPSV